MSNNLTCPVCGKGVHVVIKVLTNDLRVSSITCRNALCSVRPTTDWNEKEETTLEKWKKVGEKAREALKENECTHKD